MRDIGCEGMHPGRILLISVIFVILLVPSFASSADTVSEDAVSEYYSPYAAYGYSTWGSGTDSEPYGSTVYDLDTSQDTVFIQSALEGYPVKHISSLTGCSSSVLIIPKTVDTIDDGAFDDCSNLTTLYFLGDRPDFSVPSDVECLALEGASGWGDTETLELKECDAGDSVIDYFVIDGAAVVNSLVSGTDVVLPVSIGSGVPLMYIEDEAFRGSDIETIVFNEGIYDIGVRAFYGCWGLTDVSFPSTLINIEDEAFRDCMYLGGIELPDVRFIGFESFRDCISIPLIVIPDTVSVLCDGAFYICRGAETICVGDGISELPNRCFGYANSLVDLTLPDDLTGIGAYAFYDAYSLTSISMESVKAIGNYAFKGCDHLVSVGELASIESIGSNAFAGCGLLKDVTMAKTLESMGDSVFMDCRSLETILFEGPMPSLGNNAIPSSVTVQCYKAYASSWGSYDGSLEVLENGSSDPGLPIIVAIVAIAIILSLAIYKWRRSRIR